MGNVSPKASPFSIHLFSKIRKISILKRERAADDVLIPLPTLLPSDPFLLLLLH